ncbi:hypothetical protein CI238_00223, partial [Colletotrichum incanum]
LNAVRHRFAFVLIAVSAPSSPSTTRLTTTPTTTATTSSLLAGASIPITGLILASKSAPRKPRARPCPTKPAIRPAEPPFLLLLRKRILPLVPAALLHAHGLELSLPVLGALVVHALALLLAAPPSLLLELSALPRLLHAACVRLGMAALVLLGLLELARLLGVEDPHLLHLGRQLRLGELGPRIRAGPQARRGIEGRVCAGGYAGGGGAGGWTCGRAGRRLLLFAGRVRRGGGALGCRGRGDICCGCGRSRRGWCCRGLRCGAGGRLRSRRCRGRGYRRGGSLAGRARGSGRLVSEPRVCESTPRRGGWSLRSSLLGRRLFDRFWRNWFGLGRLDDGRCRDGGGRGRGCDSFDGLDNLRIAYRFKVVKEEIVVRAASELVVHFEVFLTSIVTKS